MSKKTNIYLIVEIALFISLLSIASLVVVPLPFSLAPITLQTVIINIISVRFKPKHSLLIVGVYILLGLIGLPVFGSGVSGISKIFSPVGGYYLGFILSAFIMSFLLKERNSFKKQLLIFICVGLPIQHICAIIWMLFFNNFDIINSTLLISLPFIFTDIVKSILSALITTKLTRIKQS